MTLDALRQRYGLRADESVLFHRFDAYFTEVAAHTNLVARSTMPARWQRHYADSMQLWDLIPPAARTLIDLGSGGGFPGIPLAILAASRRPDLHIDLVESVQKKARFLIEAGQLLGLNNLRVRPVRAETLTETFDVATARAVAPLPRLIDILADRIAKNGLLIAPKGRQADEEVRAAKEHWRFTAKRVNSMTDEDATILLLSDMERRS